VIRSSEAVSSDERHSAATANTLRWADEAAEREDYEAALGWLSVVEAIGETLPGPYRAKRAMWKVALDTSREPQERSG